MSVGKKFRYVAAAFLMLLSTVTPMGGALLRSAYAAVGDDAPATTKKIISNGDGTYTIALSVTGSTSSSTTTNCQGANVILALDISNSMINNNTTHNNSWMTRLAAEKAILTETNGVIDKMMAKNTLACPNMVEIAIVTFGNKGYQVQNFTNNATTLKNTINGINADSASGTNWEEGLQMTKSYADAIKASQANEDVYIVFMTDGEPTTHAGFYNPSNNTNGYRLNWGYANDDARELVTAGYKFYGIFTWGNSTSSSYLSSLVQYAYTGTGTYETSLDSTYADYFKDATSSSAVADALTAIANSINTAVGYTNVELTDGVTEMTASNVKAAAGGDVTGLKYYRSGGTYGTADIDNGNYGTEWADAPKATINSDEEVDWSLGNMVLENGVTYTITFVVWPKQESLDLVADLNNGKISYDSLTPEQKAQISVGNGVYKLKTNTDYPTLTYSTVTTTTSGNETTTVVSDPATVNIANPDPVDLAEKKINIEKLWDDTMDPTQREEVSSVKLYLKIDDGDYDFDDSTEEVDGIVLTEGEDGKWTANPINVAPGIMISNAASPAYTSGQAFVEYNGKTYSILEMGHDYVFREEDINNHFELTAYQHHPMIVDNEVKSVTFNYDDEGNIIGIEDIYDLPSLSATNTIKGGINIEKKVVDEDGNEIDLQDKFTAVAHLVNADGSDYSYDYRIYCAEAHDDCTNALKDENGEITGYRSDHIYGEGTLTQELYVGDTIRIVNVAAGTMYYVEESNLPTGYTLKDINAQISVGSASNFGAYTDEQTKTLNGQKYYVMQGNSAWQTIVTNKYTFGSLKISKTVDGATTNYPRSFDFTVRFYDKQGGTELTGKKFSYTGDKTGEIESGGTISLADGESVTIEGLPEGAYYEVTEAAAAGYTTTKTGNIGTIVKDDIVEAAFTNTYSLTGHVKIEAKKQFNNWPYGDTFTFNLTGEGKDLTDTIENANDSAVFEFDVDHEDTYVYTISETGELRDGVEQTSGDITVVVVATEQKDENGYGTGALSIDTQYTSADGNVITNSYEAKGTVQFSATKLLTGRDWANQESFAFTLYGSDATYSIGDEIATKNTDGEHAVVFDEIEYSFGEGQADKTFYYVIRETAKLDGTGMTNNTGDLHVKVEVTDKHDGTLETKVTYENGQVVENVYTATGDIKLKASKQLIGRDWKSGESYTFELKDASGATIATKTVSGNGEITFEDADFVSADKVLKFTQDDVLEGPITLNYTITETGDLAANGLTKSADINVTVTVSDAGNGKLKVEAAYDNNTITNTYTTAPTSVTLEAAKKFAGADREWTETFKFTLSGNGVSETKPVTEASPVATFSPILYELSDAGKTYTYTIAETDPGLAGVTASGDLTVEVAVVDNGDGTLTVTPTYTNGTEITNTYTTTPTSATLHVNKVIDDQSNSNVNGTFEFTLTGEGVNQTKSITTSNLEGGVDFDTITYDKAGMYTYTLKEVAGDASGFTYDTTEYTVVVTVVDENSVLKASVSYGEASDLTITNTYKATATSIVFTVNKKLNGLGDGLEPATFEFELYEVEGGVENKIGTKSISGAGSVPFDEITYDKVGTYNYVVREKGGSAGGYSYDDSSYNITVVVSDDNGALKTTPTITKNGQSASSITFENNYSAKGKITLKAAKVLDGRNWLEGETHTFILKDSNGSQVGVAKAVTADGEISFDEIEYTQAGSYTYTVEEVLGEDYQDGSLTPADSVTVTVTVTDEDGKGVLTATPSYGDTVPTMTNTYTATGSATINVTKNLEGRDWLDGEEFEFALYDSEGNQIGESQKVSEGEPTATFTVQYTQEDTENAENNETTIQYTVKEISEMPAGIDQPDDLSITVTLKDNGHGTIETELDQPEGYTITNEYDAEPVTVEFGVTKEIDDRSKSDANGSFTFELYESDENGNLGNKIGEQTVNTAEAEGAMFDEITYTEAGTYYYIVKEVKGSTDGFTYDEENHKVTVVVTDNTTAGKLEATIEGVDEDGSVKIMNVYKAEPTSVMIDIEKVVVGADNIPEDKEQTFEFTLTGEGENQTQTITGSGTASFDELTFEEVGTYTYTVKETPGNAEGYDYDQSVYTVIVTVTDNGGALEATVKYMQGEEEFEELVFGNIYTATPIDGYEIVVSKMLEGRDLEEGEFEFELVDTNGEVVATGTNDADGNVVFSGISFEEVGEYNFLVREIVDENRGDIDFDTAEYEITIVVADNGEGELVVESDTSSEVIFKNKYNEPGKGENPQTSDDILSVIAMLVISGIGLIGAIFFGRREEEAEA
mgnify:CR=1 FL=1